jgi:hypothetical protein
MNHNCMLFHQRLTGDRSLDFFATIEPTNLSQSTFSRFSCAKIRCIRTAPGTHIDYECEGGIENNNQSRSDIGAIRQVLTTSFRKPSSSP